MTRVLSILLAALGVLGATALPTAAARPAASGFPTPAGPPLSVPARALSGALSCPGGFTRPGREPVLLVHGTGVSPEQNYGSNYAKVLPLLGFDTCTVRLPDRALVDIQVSSEYVVAAIRTIARSSGRRVDVLGHSQGGLQPRWALRWWPDIGSLVDDLVTLGSPHHGTVLADTVPPGFCFPACYQMQTRSRFLAALNAGDETPGTPSYTSIATLFDGAVQPQFPTSTSALDGASNIVEQQLCPGRPVEHATLVFDAVAFALVMDAFTRPGPADPSRFDPRTCWQAAMPGVTLGGADPAALAGFLSPYSSGPSRGEPPLKPYAQPGAAGGAGAVRDLLSPS